MTWQFWIDRGGTFTDIVARDPAGKFFTRKLLSEHPERYDDAALAGMRQFLGCAAAAPLPQDAIDMIKMGTTVATNALLERRGEPTLLVVTQGFADVLRIGTQNRPELFALQIILPEPLYTHVVEIGERLNAAGQVLQTIHESTARATLQKAYDTGLRACAIVFMHSFRNPAHELQVAALARAVGFTYIATSHTASALMKFVGRGDTAVVDAYLSPVLRRYVTHMEQAVGTVPLQFMQSHGGMAPAAQFFGKDSILSGPAGGIVGAVGAAQAAGYGKIITFDMGGTSTDVALYNGALERSFDNMVAGVRLRVPMLNIHTVAAGGGSVLHMSLGRFRVGPASAGANPGPASYGRGGPLTITDCNVLLGKLQPQFFPAAFGAQGDAPLNAAAVRDAFGSLATQIQAQTGDSRSLEHMAEGFLQVAVQSMARAIKHISVARGHDMTHYVLCTFGGAGGQHACLVADALGMRDVMIPPFAGVLSAYGMGLADVRVLAEQTIEQPLDEAGVAHAEQALAQLQAKQLTDAAKQTSPTVERRLHLRACGSDTALPVALSDIGHMRQAFATLHRRTFGFVPVHDALTIEAVAIELVWPSGIPAAAPDDDDDATVDTAPLAPVRMFTQGTMHDTPVMARAALRTDITVHGPAIITEPGATTVVEPGWCARRGAAGALVLHRHIPLTQTSSGTSAAPSAAVDPVLLEVFNHLFMSVAERMGLTLANTAHSVNIKERLDFSCAIFAADASLVANAPHVPVHLGSMSDSVRAVVQARGSSMRPGDVYALNAPYNGGTHLPDMTVVTPVFADDAQTIVFYVASRGHHADIGGITPGSMPPHSTSVLEEGVLFDNFLLVSKGILQHDALLEHLRTSDYPARNPAQNVADMKAQIAANAQGVAGLWDMVQTYGIKQVHAYMQHVQDNAATAVENVLASLHSGSFSYAMDNGCMIAVRIDIDAAAKRATIDFTGSSPQGAHNFNAPKSVCHAAVLYVFRTLVNDDIPLNAGCMRPLNIIVPDGCMLNPTYPAAVVAGNVETSQCITDALYGALGVLAASQGTMNNFTFGDDHYQYYETICGGAGAGAQFPGASAVQTHMTNSRLTDPEVLEWRYPVHLEHFDIRRGSGGAGVQPGGDGVRRRVRFLAPMQAGILAGHRRVAPFGLAGGLPGACGRAWVERRDGSIERLAATAQVAMQEGDVFVIETPGGGGYGTPP